MRRLICPIAGIIFLGLSSATNAAPPASVTVASVEWIEQFDPGVLASGPGLNYKGSMFDSVIGGNPDFRSDLAGCDGNSLRACEQLRNNEAPAGPPVRGR